MFDQLSDHFGNIFNTYLAVFKKSFSCQITLLRLLEDWKRELDNHRNVGTILWICPIQSNAFDCLPHGIFIDKLFFLFDLILYVPSTIFQLLRDGSSWVEPVLS